jgi:hypothetical protein
LGHQKTAALHQPDKTRSIDNEDIIGRIKNGTALRWGEKLVMTAASTR